MDILFIFEGIPNRPTSKAEHQGELEAGLHRLVHDISKQSRTPIAATTRRIHEHESLQTKYRIVVQGVIFDVTYSTSFVSCSAVIGIQQAHVLLHG
jgi:hypothetical protein